MTSEEECRGRFDSSVNSFSVWIKYRRIPGLITPSARTLMLDLAGLTGAVRVVNVLIDWLSILIAIVLCMYSVYIFYLQADTICLKVPPSYPMGSLPTTHMRTVDVRQRSPHERGKSQGNRLATHVSTLCFITSHSYIITGSSLL